MAKTRRLITDNLKLVDLVVEIIDARIPISSRNPELSGWIERKPRIILLNKADAADEALTRRWLDYFKVQGTPALACDCKSGRGVEKFAPLVRQTLAELIERRVQKGMGGRMTRIMVVGIPNVGKSSFINRMAGKRAARVEDRPGVTTDKQWVRLEKDIELMDMPGVLWPKFEDQAVGEKLAFTGAIKDDIMDLELLAARLLYCIAEVYPDRLCERYKLDKSQLDCGGYELLELVGRKRGMLISGGEVNTERAAIAVLDEYRGGKIGRITFEKPPIKED